MIYLDCNATSPPHPESGRVYLEALDRYWANPDSCHRAGRCSANALEQARIRCALFLGCKYDQLIFTSGGTEANNLAIRGALNKLGPCHVITAAFEHSSVERTITSMEILGFKVSRITPGPDGVITAKKFNAAVKQETGFASIMLANNEMGAIQPILEISEICRKKNIVFHSDAVQAVGKMPLCFNELGCDLLSFSGHKLGAPRGTGGLVVRDSSILSPQVTGGHQEFDVRAGSSDVPSLYTMGFVCRWMGENFIDNLYEIGKMRETIENTLMELDPDGLILGVSAPRIANTTFFVPSCIEGRLMVEELDRRGFCVSSSAACDGGKSRITELLCDGRSGVRISISHYTEWEEIQQLCGAVKEIYAEIRKRN